MRPRATVALAEYEVEWAYAVGLRRHSANLARQDAAHYDPARMEDNIVASVAAAICELGVAKYLQRYWPASAWDSSRHKMYLEEPDVYPNIEVRRVRSGTNPLVVRRRDATRNRVMVSAYTDSRGGFQSVDINGWLPADVAWEIGAPASFDRENSRTVPLRDLRPARELVADIPGDRHGS